jgi:hypothetical protein
MCFFYRAQPTEHQLRMSIGQVAVEIFLLAIREKVVILQPEKYERKTLDY